MREQEIPKPDVDHINRHPAFVRLFERAKLRLRAGKAVLFSLLPGSRYRQIRC
jgi:hypothetical protein